MSREMLVIVDLKTYAVLWCEFLQIVIHIFIKWVLSLLRKQQECSVVGTTSSSIRGNAVAGTTAMPLETSSVIPLK